MFKNVRETSHPYGLLLISLFYLLTIGGCHGGKAPVYPQPPSQHAIKNVVVIGFRAAISDGEAPDLVRNPITGTAFMSHPVPSDLVKWLTDQLFDMLVTDKTWKLTPPGQAKGVVESIVGSDAKVGMSPLKLIQEVGKTFGADAVLTGQVYRWKERVGTDFGIESPASVAFDLSLVRPTDGAILWRGNYDKTQKSLFENLFDWNTYVKSKGLWLTAKKLATFGLEKLIAEMPGARAGKQGKD
ncbi:MAG: hypothetical protein JRL30_15460 [Deltaproteobacteria bacterium]|nr:hypothetical protein [Deltaproteobacteria bacterium]